MTIKELIDSEWKAQDLKLQSFDTSMVHAIKFGLQLALETKADNICFCPSHAELKTDNNDCIPCRMWVENQRYIKSKEEAIKKLISSL